MDKQTFNLGLLDFLRASPTPFHAVSSASAMLVEAGFKALSEGDNWQLEAGGKYFTTRNDSSLIAFVYGENSPVETGIRMVGAHTDSPCLKVKPKPDLCSKGYHQLAVEVYGGVLLHPWFDRDLSLAGRVFYRDSKGDMHRAMIDFVRPIAIIPSLAIHLDREANSGRAVNSQTDINPVLSVGQGDKVPPVRDLILAQLIAQHPHMDVATILDYELCFYDVNPPALVGWNNHFIASARLDNLLSCYVALRTLLDTDSQQSQLIVMNDHEEVGSSSMCGAHGPMLASFLQRIVPDAIQRDRMIQRSVMVSADNAHGVHPNFVNKHDGNHGPVLNQGPVIKLNSNQRYATNGFTSSLFKHWCEAVDVPVQSFVVRNDMGCGSTIGPITASEIGVHTIDIGVPTFAMHSIRETAGSDDAHYLYRVLSHFFKEPRLA
ncbi:MAG TPA: M18 family aminopeptidase [Pseudomonadales bacterium]|nr:M18 family aminopeptidase [Pseudomonadales bacterium]